jgi:hypothetical protein
MKQRLWDSTDTYEAETLDPTNTHEAETLGPN